MICIRNIRKAVFTLIATIYATICMAQDTFSVTGRVFDNRHRPLVSANINLHCKQNEFKTTTDKNGAFKVEGTYGNDYRLSISHIGFNDETYIIKKSKTDIRLDSIIMQESVIGLDETVIKPKPIRIVHDRRILYPTENQRRNSADGISLLSMMKLPRTTIIARTNEVRYWGKGNLRYYINDTKATVSQIRALLPKDIVRVEYIDRPGLEYQEQEDVELVIRVITKNGTRGTYNSIILDKQLNRSVGEINIESRTTGKSSELAVGYNGYKNGSSHHFNPEFTDETFYMPDGVIRRMEETTNMTSYENNHNISLAYFNTPSEKDYLYVKTELKLNSQPNNILNSVVYRYGPEDYKSNKHTDTSTENNAFITNVLYRKIFSKKQMMMFDATYYVTKADAYRYYKEISGNETIADIISDAGATSHGGSFTGMYRNIMSDRWILQTSAASYLNIAKSTYSGKYDGTSRLLRNISTLNGKISYRKEKFDASMILILALNHTSVADKYKSTTVEPKISLQTKYLFNERCYVGGSWGYVPIRPQINDLR